MILLPDIYLRTSPEQKVTRNLPDAVSNPTPREVNGTPRNCHLTRRST